jgi:hypothetical protein
MSQMELLMAQRQHRPFVRPREPTSASEIDQAANDNFPPPALTTTELVTHAILAWAAAVIFGGSALAMAIEFAAKAFQAPAFAELRSMGFVMAAVVGVGFAAAVVIEALRNADR